MPQKTSSQIRNLSIREEKAWKVIDYYLATKCKADGKLRVASALWVLSRLYPQKRFEHEESPLTEIRVRFMNASDNTNTPELVFSNEGDESIASVPLRE